MINAWTFEVSFCELSRQNLRNLFHERNKQFWIVAVIWISCSFILGCTFVEWLKCFVQFFNQDFEKLQVKTLSILIQITQDRTLRSQFWHNDSTYVNKTLLDHLNCWVSLHGTLFEFNREFEGILDQNHKELAKFFISKAIWLTIRRLLLLIKNVQKVCFGSIIVQINIYICQSKEHQS